MVGENENKLERDKIFFRIQGDTERKWEPVSSGYLTTTVYQSLMVKFLERLDFTRFLDAFDACGDKDDISREQGAALIKSEDGMVYFNIIWCKVNKHRKRTELSSTTAPDWFAAALATATQ